MPRQPNASRIQYPAQSWNRYSYVFNNPLALIDHLGLCGDGPSSMVVNPDGSVTVSADAPCCDPGTTMRSIGIPGGTMFVCLGYGDTTTNGVSRHWNCDNLGDSRSNLA